jgi:hypothetical protein
MAGPSQNLALRARATASSEYSEGTPAMAAVDGRDDTIWASVASDAAGPWWQVSRAQFGKKKEKRRERGQVNRASPYNSAGFGGRNDRAFVCNALKADGVLE